MSIEENKALARRQFEEIWNQGQLNLIDTFFSSDFINFGRPFPLDRVRQIVTTWRTAFPDLHFSVEAQIAEGDQVLSHCTLSGTHLGPFVHPGLGSFPPTGKRFEVKHMHLDRLHNGLLVEHRAVRDDLGMLQQLGLVSSANLEAQH